MNVVTCTAQTIINLYEGGAGDPPDPAPLGPCLVIYCVTAQSNLKMVCFHAISNGEVLSCYEPSDTKTVTQWLAGRTKTDASPLYMWPQEVDDLDSALNIITCTSTQFQALAGYVDQAIYLYALHDSGPNAGKIAKAALADPNTSGKIKIKAIISDAPTEAWWLAEVAAGAVKADAIDFSTLAA